MASGEDGAGLPQESRRAGPVRVCGARSQSRQPSAASLPWALLPGPSCAGRPPPSRGPILPITGAHPPRHGGPSSLLSLGAHPPHHGGPSSLSRGPPSLPGGLHPAVSAGPWALTVSSISRVCAAETQNRARASARGVAGNPTTTTPIFLSNRCLAKALRERLRRRLTER